MATSTLGPLVSGAKRLVFDTILPRGMGGGKEVCFDGPIEGVTSGMPGS